MDYGFKGKVALVTGTGSQIGIGKGAALALAKEGCDVISVDLDFEGATQTANEVKALGRKAMAAKVDVANRPEVVEAVKSALQEFGKIDILVNSAGLAAGGGPFVNQEEKYWQKDMAVNVFGTMNCVQAVIPGMFERKYGKIVNFSSISGRLGLPVSYAAAKGAIIAATRGWATELGPSGINVNAIAPGTVLTKFHRGGQGPTPEMLERMIASVPLRRVQTVEDVANTVAFLASDASCNITGQCIQVDSGRVMP